MKPHRHWALVFALVALLVNAAAASAADSVLFKDDAEGKIEDNWLVTQPTDSRIQPWQKSDSPTPKFRQGEKHAGAASYWTGQSPPFDPYNVITGDDIMTLNKPLVIPADGQTTIAFWSLYQMEGDDIPLVEAAIVDDAKPVWKKVGQIKINAASAGGDYEYGYCDPSHPAETANQAFVETKLNFGPMFVGKKVMLRFNLKWGAENRILTQECGWFLDDILVSTTGTPGNLGTGGPTAPPAAGPPAKAAATIGGLRAKGKKGTLTVYVSGQPINKAKITVLDGKKRIAGASVKTLAVGTNSITLKSKRPIKVKAYTVKIIGTAADGSRVTVVGKTHDK